MIALYAALFAGHVGIGFVGVLAWYRVYERSLNLAVVFAAVAAVVSVFAWSVAGEVLFEFTVPQFKAAIIATVAGAVIGVSLGVLLFEPDTGSGWPGFDRPGSSGGGGEEPPGFEEWLSENRSEKRQSEMEVES